MINGASVTGGLCGTLTVGAGAPPPPATDGNVDYPDANETTWQGNGPRILPGFVLSLFEGTTDGTRVRFGIDDFEPWKGWCGLQTPYDTSPTGSCNCLPNWSVAGDTDCTLSDPSGAHDDIHANCAKAALCSTVGGVCTCNGSGCTAVVGASTNFDLRFAGDEAEGSATSAPTARAHFTRVP